MTPDPLIDPAARIQRAAGSRAARPQVAAAVEAPLVTEAEAQSVAAQRHAGITVTELTDLAELAAVYWLFDEIWSPDPTNAPITPEMLRALVKGDNYVAGAYAGGELIGACVGFFGPPTSAALHSHIAGVRASGRGRRVGLALKIHQRAWALARSITTVSWTFDPLVRRNAHFNLVRLAAHVTEYIPNFYGTVNDGINGSDDTDRLLAQWHLTSPRVRTALARATGVGKIDDDPAGGDVTEPPAVVLAEGADGRPISTRAADPMTLRAAATPADIEQLRRTDPAAASDWRRELRAALTPASDIIGFDDSGRYLLRSDHYPTGGMRDRHK